MDECLFCKIIKGEIPSKKVFEDELCYAFFDIAPMAPVHILIIPKRHVESVAALSESADDTKLLSHMISVANLIAKEQNIYDKGFRLVFNTGKESGQTVFHLHMHLLGGADLGKFGTP